MMMDVFFVKEAKLALLIDSLSLTESTSLLEKKQGRPAPASSPSPLEPFNPEHLPEARKISSLHVRTRLRLLDLCSSLSVLRGFSYEGRWSMDFLGEAGHEEPLTHKRREPLVGRFLN
ncbi:hypothetical protein NL676_001655 [Syzygium grande]|nr:hypothetical protein NL676_001655 [Syzygium grande]